jgi:hypothetical protein
VMQLGIFGPEVGGEDLAAKIDSATLSYSVHNHSKQRLSVHDFDVSRQLGLSSSANEAAQGCVRFVQVVLAIVVCVHVRLRFLHERGSNTTARSCHCAGVSSDFCLPSQIASGKLAP